MKSKPAPPALGRPTVEREAADSQIQLRTTMARKNAYVRAARPGPLTDWMFSVCDKAAKYTPKPNPDTKP